MVGEPAIRAFTLALLTSLKTGLGRSPSRLRRVTQAFRIGLIAWGYLPTEDRTPWDFIGERDVLCAWRDCMYHENRGSAANRMCGHPTCPRGQQAKQLRPKGGGSL